MADAATGNRFRFCPFCGDSLEETFRHGALRPACSRCGFVHFHDPKVAVVGLVTRGERVLLVRRAFEPARGMWALPGGFMDGHEPAAEALRRELAEETGVEICVQGLMAHYPLTGSGGEVSGIVLCFAAEGVSETITPGDDVAEAAWFAADELPTELAFVSTQELLNLWASGRTVAPVHKE